MIYHITPGRWTPANSLAQVSIAYRLQRSAVAGVKLIERLFALPQHKPIRSHAKVLFDQLICFVLKLDQHWLASSQEPCKTCSAWVSCVRRGQYKLSCLCARVGRPLTPSAADLVAAQRPASSWAAAEVGAITQLQPLLLACACNLHIEGPGYLLLCPERRVRLTSAECVRVPKKSAALSHGSMSPCRQPPARHPALYQPSANSAAGAAPCQHWHPVDAFWSAHGARHV